MLADMALVTKGNLGAQVWASPPPLRSREEGKQGNQQNGKGVLTGGGENSSLCLPSIARMEKIKAKQKKIAAPQ